MKSISVEVWGMMVVGVAFFAAGLIFVRTRFRSASGVAAKIVVLGPVFEAVALAVFAAEHFLAARDLMLIVPKWLPGPLFWTYFVGAAWLAAATSLIAWRQVRLSSSLVALLFLIIVVTLDFPNVSRGAHSRLFWTLTVRETAFGAGAMVLAGSLWAGSIGVALRLAGRIIVSGTFVFYAVEHFLFPRFVPGVPLEKLTPAWMPAPVLISYFVGVTLFAAGVGLLFTRATRIAAAGAGIVLLLLTVLFYVPILLTELHTPLAVEGVNYVGDTLLFAATALLAGSGVDTSALPSSD